MRHVSSVNRLVSGFCSCAVYIFFFWIYNVDFSVNKFTRYEKLNRLKWAKKGEIRVSE